MRAVVLMSTFNGGAHVEQQICSILNQDFPDVTLFIRDDGSSDNTLDILSRFATDRKVRVVQGSRLGLPQTFFNLIATAPTDADLYLLADQDDIWHPDKISAAATALGAHILTEEPRLYCSRLRLVGPDKNIKGLSPNWKRPPIFGNALIENICTGCTAAFNPAALALLRQGLPDKRQPNTDSNDDPSLTTHAVIHHDWWLYLVISAFGRVIFDPVPHIDYRIHNANVVGLPTGPIDNLKRRLLRHRLEKHLHQLIDQADTFSSKYASNLAPEKNDLIEALRAMNDEPRAASRLLKETRIFRQKRGDDIVWRAALAAYAARIQRFFPRSA